MSRDFSRRPLPRGRSRGKPWKSCLGATGQVERVADLRDMFHLAATERRSHMLVAAAHGRSCHVVGLHFPIRERSEMFFKRKAKRETVPEQRADDPRAVDVRVTTIEPLQLDIRQTFDVGDNEDDFRKIGDFTLPETIDAPRRHDDGTQPFRPRFRPPMAVLKVFDDNQKTGELTRIRGNRLKIGRDEGDLVIPHDKLMSGCHAELIRRFEEEAYVWHLHDLKSRNGSFVKIDFMRLRAGDEFILGSATYVFEESRQSSPRLIELGSRQPRQVKFEQEDFWIGRDRKSCVPALADDGLLEDKHVRIHFAKQRWCLEAAPSKNGVWARIDQVQLNNGTRFQLGEQRFQILIP